MSGKKVYAGMILTYGNHIHYLLLVIDAFIESYLIS